MTTHDVTDRASSGSDGPGASLPRGPRITAERWWLVFAAAVHAAVFAPVILSALFRPQVFPSLWLWHAARVPETFVDWQPVQVHFGWPALSRLIGALLGASDPRIGGAIVSILAAAGFGAALFALLRTTDEGRALLPRSAALAVSLVVALLESPAAIQGWTALADPDRSFLPLYYPFVPTTTAAMGLNVVAVWMTARLLDGRLARSRTRWLPLVLVAAAIAKPNLVPSLAAVAVLAAHLTDRARAGGAEVSPRVGPVLRDVLTFVAAPAAVVTFVQYLIIVYFSPPRLQGSVELRPLYELSELGGFGWQFWLVLSLPMIALVWLRKRLVVDLAVAMSFGALLVGLVAALLFARAGSTPDKGSVGGDILQLAGGAAAVLVVFTIRRLIVLFRSGDLTRSAAVVFAALLLPYVVAGLDTWRCHSGASECYPGVEAPAWPQPPLDSEGARPPTPAD